MEEYRLIYQYNKDHWTAVCAFSNPEDMYKYISDNEIELTEAIEQSDQYLYIEHYLDGYFTASWRGEDINKLLLSFQYIAYPWLEYF